MVKIYLDAGHGGTDSGAVGNDVYEKNVNLSIVKKIQAQLEKDYKNVEIMCTRTTDVFLSLNARTDKANKWGADYFISVHINSATVPSAKGFESHIYTKASDKSKALQNVMHEEILKQIGNLVEDRGKKASNFHVLRESNMAAILTENLFVSNLGDAKLLKSDDFLNKVATGHVNGLAKFIGLDKVASPTPPTTEEIYQVICGSYNLKANAENQVKKLKADGYEAYIFKKE